MVDYLEEVKKQIARLYSVDEDLIEEDSYLESDLNISELDLEDLITALEDKYQIEIPHHDWSNFRQVADISNYLYENVDQA